MDIPFSGGVCPYCQRDKSRDQAFTVLAVLLGVGFAFLGGKLFGMWGAIGGFIVGAVIAGAMSGVGNTEPPEVQVTNVVTTAGSAGLHEQRLVELKELRKKGLIDDAEYSQKKKEVLDAL